MNDQPSDRRSNPFTEKLSWLMAWAAALGGAYVIIDPVITLHITDSVQIKLGGDGFAEQMKGAVLALILVEGWKAVKEYWLGSSAGSAKSADVMQRIAEAAPTVAAAAAAAAAPTPKNGHPVKADDVTVNAAGDVTVKKDG